MKRKDIEYVNEDFSDFSLAPPATKIRRLDAELPPIIEEDEQDFPWWIKTPAASAGVENLASNIMNGTGSSSQGMVEMPETSENVDRAIVLFNPTPLPLSSSRFSVDSGILSGIKKNIHLSNPSSLIKSAEDEEEVERRKNIARRKECLAVIPWNPSLQPLRYTETSRNNLQGELEEDEQMGESTIMDIEEDKTGTEYYSQQMNENLPQWQQQQQQYSHMNENLLQWQQQQQQYSHMNENLLQWQQQQQQQQYSQMNENLLQWQQLQQQQQQQHCMMIQQPPQSASSSPLMQNQWW